jgi:acetyl-CoA carboxylase biotin carboxylase subunit
MDYDPMLSKLIAYAPTRDLAIARMLRALDEYVIGGIRTNLDLFRQILRDPEFRAARIDTGYLDRLLASSPPGAIHLQSAGDPQPGPPPIPAIAAAAVFEATKASNGLADALPSSSSVWKNTARREAVGGLD